MGFFFRQPCLLGFDFLKLSGSLDVAIASFARGFRAVIGKLRGAVIETAQNILLTHLNLSAKFGSNWLKDGAFGRGASQFIEASDPLGAAHQEFTRI